MLAENPSSEEIQWKLFELNEKTNIVRYMSLSAYLLLLCGRAFLPSLRRLQEIDKSEGRLPSVLFPHTYGRRIKEILEIHEDFLLQKAQGLKVKKIPGDKHNDAYFKFLAGVWLVELAKRRCIWCWNRYEHESYALWKLYGFKGVAVHSTIGHVKRALEKSGPFRCLVAPIKYAFPRRKFFLGEKSDSKEPMMQPSFLKKPYLFKEIGYEYEAEIRFVFGTNPDLVLEERTSDGGLPGVFIELNWPFPVDQLSVSSNRIEVSPELPKAERDAIQTILQSLDSQTLGGLQEPDKEFDPPYPGGSPFTMSEDPSGLFIDLDFQRARRPRSGL